jgi:hypothetical protein
VSGGELCPGKILSPVNRQAAKGVDRSGEFFTGSSRKMRKETLTWEALQVRGGKV